MLHITIKDTKSNEVIYDGEVSMVIMQAAEKDGIRSIRHKTDDASISDMINCVKSGTWHKWLNKQEKVLYSTHSAEIDYVAGSKTEQRITDLLIEFDEMGFAPTTVCNDAEKYAIDWRERVRKEFARLTAELECYKRAPIALTNTEHA